MGPGAGPRSCPEPTAVHGIPEETDGNSALDHVTWCASAQRHRSTSANVLRSSLGLPALENVLFPKEASHQTNRVTLLKFLPSARSPGTKTLLAMPSLVQAWTNCLRQGLSPIRYARFGTCLRAANFGTGSGVTQTSKGKRRYVCHSSE